MSPQIAELSMATDSTRNHFLICLLGITLEEIGDQRLSASLQIGSQHLNPLQTSCHAATKVAIADTACGWRCIAHLPHKARTFTTVSLGWNCPL